MNEDSHLEDIYESRQHGDYDEADYDDGYDPLFDDEDYDDEA